MAVLRKVSFLFLCVFFFKIEAQEINSIHYLEWLAHRHLPAAASFFDPQGKDIIALQPRKQSLPEKNIFGYLPDWEYVNSRPYLQYDVLTHIAAFDFMVDANGNISNPRYWPWTDIINEAHSYGVKVILVAVNFNRDQIRNILSNASVKNNFFSQIKNKIIAYKLDGVNIDFESLYSADRGALLNNFMTELTEYIHDEVSGAEVSFAGPAVNWGGWNLAGLAAACDYIFIMGYAFNGKWSSSAGPQAPLSGGTYNISNTVNVQYGEVTNQHPQKLILGLPYYGGRWQTVSAQPYAAANDFENSPRFRTAAHESVNYGPIWDARSQTPWYAYQIGNDWYQVWCDNAASLGLKYNLAEEKNYRGVGMWALGYDNGRSELWNELRRRYVPGSVPQPDIPTGIALRPEGDDFISFSAAEQDYCNGFVVSYGTDPALLQNTVFSAKNKNIIRHLQKDSLYFFEIQARNEKGLSAPAGPLAAVCSGKEADVLIVDGFERNAGNGNHGEIIARHVQAFYQLGYSAAVTQNRALINGDVQLQDYRYCDWLLGEESTADFTFNVYEKEIVKEYLSSGGNLFVSGSEIGWDLVAEKASRDDKLFFENILKAKYINDAPLGKKATYYNVEPTSEGIFAGIAPFRFDDGSQGTYDVDWPDAIDAQNGADLALLYSGVDAVNGGCAVSYQGVFEDGSAPAKLVYLSFPYETIYPQQARLEVLQKIMEFFTQAVKTEAFPARPLNFVLEQNYPNPFGEGCRLPGHSNTMIRYELRTTSRIELTVYNVLGQSVRKLVDRKQMPGKYSVTFEARGLAPGLYYYRLKAGNFSRVRKMILIK